MIKLGSNNIADFKVGTSSVSKIMLGSTLVWQKGVPIYEPVHDIFNDGSCISSLWFMNNLMDGITGVPASIDICNSSLTFNYALYDERLWYMNVAGNADGIASLYSYTGYTFNCNQDIAVSFWTLIPDTPSPAVKGIYTMAYDSGVGSCPIWNIFYNYGFVLTLTSGGVTGAGTDYAYVSNMFYRDGYVAHINNFPTINSRWVHIVHTADYTGGVSGQVYVDGSLVGSASGNITDSTDNSPYSNIQLTYGMNLTGVRFFKRNLSQSDVTTLHNELKDILQP